LDNEGLKLEILRGHPVNLPALIMSPCGIPVLHAVLNGAVKILTVVDQIFSALSYSHRNGVYHLDVNPRNIIYDGEKVILIDFSIGSSDCNEDRKGFRGTVDYAHRDIFEYHPAKSWPKEKAKYEEFDAAGLYFNAAVVQNKGELPWSPIRDFPKTLVKNNAQTFVNLMSDRQRTAAKLVDDIYDSKRSFPFANTENF
jgi:serine/threonine protein kinase